MREDKFNVLDSYKLDYEQYEPTSRLLEIGADIMCWFYSGIVRAADAFGKRKHSNVGATKSLRGKK